MKSRPWLMMLARVSKRFIPLRELQKGVTAALESWKFRKSPSFHRSLLKVLSRHRVQRRFHGPPHNLPLYADFFLQSFTSGPSTP
jgi:hypothetical protein